jgi:hypothetical protein
MSITRPVFTTANEIKAQIDLRSKLAGHYCGGAGFAHREEQQCDDGEGGKAGKNRWSQDHFHGSKPGVAEFMIQTASDMAGPRVGDAVIKTAD